MQIILVSDRMVTARTITLSTRHLMLTATGLLLLILSVSSLFSVVTLRHAAAIPLPFVQNLLQGMRAQEAQKTQEFLRENLNVMAVKLGQMQAQLIRLDSLGERLAGFAGIKPQEFRMQEQPGRGGPLVETAARYMSAAELQQQLDLISSQVDLHGDYLGLIESEMLDERVRLNLLPTTLPLQTQWNASGFGWRNDPFTGQRTLHEGVDFIADSGAPIVAAAAGVVIAAEFHPAYGNLVEIDHGNGLTTRYAHASMLWVKQGEIVKRGQKIAAVGSTGRSTGSHLHFEVRSKGVAQNPNRFLQYAQKSASASSVAAVIPASNTGRQKFQYK